MLFCVLTVVLFVLVISLGLMFLLALFLLLIVAAIRRLGSHRDERIKAETPWLRRVLTTLGGADSQILARARVDTAEMTGRGIAALIPAVFGGLAAVISFRYAYAAAAGRGRGGRRRLGRRRPVFRPVADDVRP